MKKTFDMTIQFSYCPDLGFILKQEALNTIRLNSAISNGFPKVKEHLQAGWI